MSPKLGNANNSSAVTIKASAKAPMAASVGANTVKGPSALNASTRPAAPTADSKSVWSSLFTMMSTTVVASGVGGNNTASITCTTPLSATMSAAVTMASLMNTPVSPMVTVTLGPRSVAIS